MDDMPRWHADVALLGETTHDGRRLREDGTWRWRENAPLLYENQQIGVVDRGETIPYDEGTDTAGVLRAYGSIAFLRSDVYDALRRGELFPEIDLGWATSHGAADGRTFVFTSGTVVAVHAGRAPAWPGLRFFIEE